MNAGATDSIWTRNISKTVGLQWINHDGVNKATAALQIGVLRLDKRQFRISNLDISYATTTQQFAFSAANVAATQKPGVFLFGMLSDSFPLTALFGGVVIQSFTGAVFYSSVGVGVQAIASNADLPLADNILQTSDLDITSSMASNTLILDNGTGNSFSPGDLINRALKQKFAFAFPLITIQASGTAALGVSSSKKATVDIPPGFDYLNLFCWPGLDGGQFGLIPEIGTRTVCNVTCNMDLVVPKQTANV